MSFPCEPFVCLRSKVPSCSYSSPVVILKDRHTSQLHPQTVLAAKSILFPKWIFHGYGSFMVRLLMHTTHELLRGFMKICLKEEKFCAVDFLNNVNFLIGVFYVGSGKCSFIVSRSHQFTNRAVRNCKLRIENHLFPVFLIHPNMSSLQSNFGPLGAVEWSRRTVCPSWKRKAAKVSIFNWPGRKYLCDSAPGPRRKGGSEYKREDCIGNRIKSNGHLQLRAKLIIQKKKIWSGPHCTIGFQRHRCLIISSQI